ncbi:LysR family transcriptional regulator [Paraburkholderia unamae]|uniref:LysR family transcriptional regulator n=1 Tax=Paraburkholderia unamae TaxID=219649 RepID=UPI000DC44EB2|nr:LysR family transcriptional regulator [Paraburkholderia unamae]RAR50686.1 LysR family transcriptional regulator [Paraburkholderia unamae]
MKHVNLATVDLNLLKTFVAIWEHRSLTVAGDRLHLSQPAVSHALRRLREIFDDPLFVRNAGVMVPTDAASRLHAPIDDALAIIYGALQRHSRFDPAEASRTFRLAMSDIAEQHVLPILMGALTTRAPHINLDVRQLSIDELNSAMRSGEIDFALGYLPGLSDECENMPFLSDEFVCMVRAAHPFDTDAMTTDDLQTLRYVYVQTNSTGHGLVDSAFRKAGIAWDIALRLPHFTVAVDIIATSDLALIVPRSIAERHARGGKYRLYSLPIEMPKISVKIYWHSRFSSDTGSAWLRTILLTLFSDAPVEGEPQRIEAQGVDALSVAGRRIR